MLLIFPRAALGANFSQSQERGATNIGNFRATSDTEMRKIGPSPLGCGENRDILRSHARRAGPHSIRTPPRRHPTAEVRGARGLARFALAMGSPARMCWGRTLPAR